MKIKTKYINKDENRYTNIGEYVYYRELLLKCVDAEGDCSNCFFQSIGDDGLTWCLIDYPESEQRCFDCMGCKDGGRESVKFIEV